MRGTRDNSLDLRLCWRADLELQLRGAWVLLEGIMAFEKRSSAPWEALSPQLLRSDDHEGQISLKFQNLIGRFSVGFFRLLDEGSRGGLWDVRVVGLGAEKPWHQPQALPITFW